MYKDLNYDILVITDHNKLTDCSKYITERFLCINGEELTYKSHATFIKSAVSEVAYSMRMLAASTFATRLI